MSASLSQIAAFVEPVAGARLASRGHDRRVIFVNHAGEGFTLPVPTIPRAVKVRGMPVWSILLRLLLVVALVFNTTGTAVASVHLDHLGAVQAAQPSKATTTKASPCHEHRQATAAAADEQPAAAGQTAQKQHSTPDCCKSGACRCTCIHHAPALMVALGFYPLIIDHAKSARPMPSGHAPPALPHLIRPPIG